MNITIADSLKALKAACFPFVGKGRRAKIRFEESHIIVVRDGESLKVNDFWLHLYANQVNDEVLDMDTLAIAQANPADLLATIPFVNYLREWQRIPTTYNTDEMMDSILPAGSYDYFVKMVPVGMKVEPTIYIKIKMPVLKALAESN
jgi:hypothetical protein